MTIQYLMLANYKIYQKLLMQRLDETELSAGQPKILDYLSEHDGANKREIAMACHIEPASLTSALNGMENKGLVERRRQDGNRRSYYVFMTEKGKEMCRRVEEAFAGLEEEMLAGMQGISREELTNILSDIHSSLERMAKEE